MRATLALHIRRSIFVFVAPPLTALGFLLAWGGSYPLVATHGNIAAVTVSASAVLTPLLAGFSAWDGLREYRNHGSPIIDTAAQPRTRVMLVQELAGMIYTAAIFLVIIAALYVRASMFYTLVGSPHYLQLAVTLATLLASAVLGYTVALLSRHWVAVVLAPVLPIAVYGAALFPSRNLLLASLPPFGNRSGGDFLEPNPWFFLGQLLVILGLTGVTLALTAAAARADRWIGTIFASTAIVVTMSGVVTVNTQQGEWGRPIQNVVARLEPFEAPNGGLTLWLQPSYTPVAPTLLDTWSRVQSILDDTPLAFDELSHLTDSHPPGGEVGQLERIYLNPTSSSPAGESVVATIGDVRVGNCQMTTNVVLVQFWLAGPGAEATSQLAPDAAAKLAALRDLNEEESRVWMSEHFDQVASCDVPDESFPRG